MPKRSNDFQRLIKRIYEQLMPMGATVTESAMLNETTSDLRREVDVLIELPLPGVDTPTRIAIECRDHVRQSDVSWIDALQGKYRDLPVHRVIAVSRQTFTPGAARKAHRCRIETRTLKDALATDWPEELFDIEFTNVLHWPVVTEISVETTPPWPEGTIPGIAQISNMTVERTGFLAWARKHLAEAFAIAIQCGQALGRPTFEAVGTHRFSTAINNPQVVLHSEDGTQHHVTKMTISGVITVEHEPLTNRRYRFGNVGVTHARGAVHGGEIDAVAVQEEGKELSVNIIRSMKKR
jgi:hypothetical protein